MDIGIAVGGSDTTDGFGHSVQQCREALRLIPRDHPEQLQWLEKLASGHLDQFRKTRVLTDLELTIEAYQQALSFTLENEDRARLLENLGQRFRDRYEFTGTQGNVKDLELSIEYNQRALELTSKELFGQVSRLMNLGDGYRDRFLVVRELDDLDCSIQSFQQVLNLTPHKHDQAYCLSNLGDGFRERYKRTNLLGDLGLSIQNYEQALLTTLEDCGQANRPIELKDEFREQCFASLGNGFKDRYDHAGVLNDLELSIQSRQQALDLTVDDGDRSYHLGELTDLLKDQYEQTATSNDLELAIQICQQALNLVEDDDDKVFFLCELGNRLSDQYQHTRTSDDFDVAMQAYKQALDFTQPEDYTAKMRLYDILGSGYRDRFRQTKASDDIKTSFQFYKQALDLTTEEDMLNRLYQSWNLGIVCLDKYGRTGSLDDLELSIQICQEVLNLTPEKDPFQAEYRESLGSAYRNRYLRLGALEDLELSINLWKSSLDLVLTTSVTDEHSVRAGLAEKLGTAYIDLYTRREFLSDLEIAIRYFREGVDLTPDNHSDRARRLENLGVAYIHRYARTKSLDDLEFSTKYFQEALDLVSVNHPDRAYWIGNFAGGFLEHYERTGVLNDLELFVQYAKEALDFTTDDDPDRARRLGSLGLGLYRRYQHTGIKTDLEACILCYEEALNHKISPPTARLFAGKELLFICARAQDWLKAYNAASLTISLIPLLTTRASEHSDTQHRTKELVGLGSVATTIALKAGRTVYEALQLFEVSRGIIARALSDRRIDTSDLDEKYPYLAANFHKLRDLLDTQKERRKESERYNVGKKFEELIQEIRRMPGFENFLLPPNENEFKMAASSGPVVIVNISFFGCHALIIEQEQLRALELPLEFQEAWNQVDDLADPDAEILGWIWNTVASPVLEALNLVQTPTHIWPRIWWIMTGPLVRFPIHAAGNYSDDEISDTVMDRTISSYSSSISAITKARQNPLTSISLHHNESTTLSPLTYLPQAGSMVLISMPETPGYSSLKHASKEVKVVSDLGALMQLQIDQPNPYKQDILSSINGCKIFHFAGHGYTSSSDPSKSALVLNDGQLTVESIFDTNLHQHKPFLAYLSACGTSQVKDNQLIDEGIHLVSAFQLAGFRHVIGTLREVNDESCVEVARLTYMWMQQQGLSDRSVSEGLHHACRELRKRWTRDRNARSASKKKEEVMSDRKNSHAMQAETRDLRDVEILEDSLLQLHWVPYVHFGV